MEPFLALGQEMKSSGHDVAFCLPAQFETLAKEVSPRFYPQDRSFIELIESPEIRNIMGQVGSGFSRIRTVLGLLSKTRAIQEKLITDQEKAVQHFEPDEVVFHIKCIYPVFWALKHRGNVRLLSPMPCLVHPTSRHPHIAFGKPRGAAWNRITYRIAEYALVRQSILGYGKRFMRERGIEMTPKDLTRFYRNELPVEYAYNETLFPRPTDWPSQAVVSRFRQRKPNTETEINAALQSFLDEHDAVVYVGFGSMVNAHPKLVAEDIVRVSGRMGLAVVLNRSWGGLEPSDSLPSHAIAVDHAPFHTLFPRMKAIVHHGGSGTTHIAAQSGTPQAIIPHIADQFFWSRQVVASKKGVEGFPIKQWSEQRFESLLKSLMQFQP